MDFDINEVLSDMLAAIKGSIKEDWSTVKDTANAFMQARKERLKLLADLRLAKDISQELFEARLLDEKKILESELHAIAIISKVVAQNAANAAIQVLITAVKVLVKI